MIELYTYCSDNEISQVNWSNDAYHDELDYKNIKLLKTLSFVSPRNPDDYREYPLIRQGRAESSINRELTPESFEYLTESDTLIEGILYLNCKGNLIAGCDYSYENQDHNIICHVDNFCLDLIIESGLNFELAV